MANYSKRLREYATKIETRLQNALASRDLTPRQRTAIETQSKKFHSLMKRLEGAFLSGHGTERGSALHDMHSVLDHIVSSMNDALVDPKSAGSKIAPKLADAPSVEQHGGLDTVA